MLGIGTSGRQYRDWRGRFYPEGLPQRRWLEHYAGHFPTAGFGYLRLHEGRAKPRPRSGRTALKTWLRRLDAVREGFVFFNNDPGGAAVTDADALRALVDR